MSISVDIPIIGADGIEVDAHYNLSTHQASFGVAKGLSGMNVYVEANNVFGGNVDPVSNGQLSGDVPL